MSLSNAEIARALDDIASLLEIEEASPFRVRAYRNGADAIRASPEELSEVLASGRPLTELPDVGKAIAAKVEEMIARGGPAYPAPFTGAEARGLLELLSLPGLGPRRVRLLREELHVTNAAELRAAAEARRLRALPGFGAKTEERILRRLREREPPDRD